MNYIQFLHQMHLDQHYQLQHRMNNVELALCNLFLILLSISIGSIIVIKSVWEPMKKEGESHYDDDDLKYESYLDKYPIHEYIRACQEFDDDEDDDTSGSEYETSGDEEEEEEDEDSRGKNILIENTPEGTVFMNYNHEKEGFNYWSNTQIPFEYINTVARKYVITFDCVEFYVLSEEEKKLVDKLQDNDSDDEEDGEDGEDGEEEDGEKNQKEDKSDDDDYEKIIQSELEDAEKANKNKEEDGEKDAEKDAEKDSEKDDESSEESSSEEEEDEKEKKLHNKFIYQGKIRNLDILNKKSFEKNNSKSFSFADFMKMQSN